MSALLVLEGAHTNTPTHNLNSDLHRHNHTDTHMHSHTSTHMDVRTVSCLYNMHVCMHTLNSKPSPHSHSIFHVVPIKGNWSKWLFTELFVTSVAMLESDYESEFVNATWLLEKVMGLLDQSRQRTRKNWPTLFKSSNRPNFPGVQACWWRWGGVMRLCVSVVVERGTCIALLQSHVEWRESSWLVSVYSVMPGANFKRVCDMLLL